MYYLFARKQFLASLMLPALLLLSNGFSSAVAQLSSNPSGPSVTFQNVQVDTNPAPNQPFKVNATISVSDPAGRNVLVGISAPTGISVLSPAVVNLGFITPGMVPPTATWSLLANAPGTYTVTLTATSTNSQTHTSDSNTYQLSFSVGSAKGLVVTAVNIPGNVSLSDVFPIGIQLKNTGIAADTNIILTLFAPSGIHVLGDVSKNIASMNPNQAVYANWTIVADSAGSFPITFSYVSTNSGSGSFSASVNVATVSTADIRASDIRLAGANPTSSAVGPGDANLPLDVNLTNVGNLWIYNMNARILLDKPLYWQDPNGNSTQVFQTQELAPGASVHSLFFVSVKQDARPGVYQAHLLVSFNYQKVQLSKSIAIPINIGSRPVVSIDPHKTLVVANNITQIIFDVLNKGSVSVHNLKVLSTTGTYTSVNTPIWLGDLGIAESKTVSMDIYTAAETSSLIPLPLTLVYQAGGVSYNSTFQVAVSIQGQPNFQIHTISFKPSSIYPGANSARIDINVLNSGQGIAHNLYASLSLPAGFTPAWGNATSTYQGDVSPNSSFVLSFFVNVSPEIQAGAYPVYLKLNYDKGQSKSDFTFDVSAKANFIVAGVDDSQLYPGASNVPLIITVKNTGNITAETATAKLLGANGITGVKSSTITSLGDVVLSGNILPGQSVPMTFVVNVNPTFVAGEQTTSVEIDWTQNSNSSSFVNTVTVPYHLNSGPAYLLYYQGVPLTYLLVAGIIAVVLIVYLIERRRKSTRISYAIENEQPPQAIEEDETFSNPRLPDASRVLKSPDDNEDLR